VISLIEKGAHIQCREETLQRLAIGFACGVQKLRELLPPRNWKTPKTELGKFIQKLRVELGKTRDEIAEAIKKNRHYVSDLELGDIKSMNRGIAKSLAGALQCGVEELLAFRDPRLKECRSEIGKYVREWRISQNLFQPQLAKILHTFPSYVSAVERGMPHNNLSQLPDKKLLKWANALQVGLEELKSHIPPRKSRHPAARKVSALKVAQLEVPSAREGREPKIRVIKVPDTQVGESRKPIIGLPLSRETLRNLLLYRCR